MAQRTPEAVPALAPVTHRLQLDLVGEELPQHLTRLRCVVAKERGQIADLFLQGALEMPAVQAGNAGGLLELRKLGLEGGLPRLLGTQAFLDLISGERAIRQGVH